ncbi:MAG: ABC transporter permease [Rickettsiales bacterium]|nr:ABC transporter permease [Rickettsiales bacterium]
MTLLRGIVNFIVLILIWHILVVFFKMPSYILPSPVLVLKSFWQHAGFIFQQSIPTLIEASSGFVLSIFLGTIWALLLSYFQPIRSWFLPILLISQALPTFAIAPLFILWFGYGLTSKIMIICLMLFFPITSSFYDGLCRTHKIHLDLAQVMNASKLKLLLYIRLPAALPSFGNGLRIAATFAPLGAILGEWVGSTEGLGFLILNANSRMQIDLMFASLISLIILTLSFYFLVDLFIKHITLKL